MKFKKMWTRRQFIENTGKAITTAIAFPAIIPSSVLGKSGTVSPSNRITMGCIGLGGQGTHNMRAFLQHPDVQIVALCDVDAGTDSYDRELRFAWGFSAGLEPAMRQAARFYEKKNRTASKNTIQGYGDFRELLAREDIDAVSVCTPDHWHGIISVAAVKAGKDIYCEKPLTNSIPEGRAVCDAVKRYGRILQTGSHERSNDSVRFACELVRNGRIGKLQTIRVNMPNNDPHHNHLLQNLGPKPVGSVPEGLDYDMWLGHAPWRPYIKERCHFWWRFFLDYGGGEMTDRGAHIIDLCQLANDTDESGPVRIEGRGEAPRTGVYNTFLDYQFECVYENGVKIIGSSQGERGLKLEGTEGWIFIHIHGGRLEAAPDSLLQEFIDTNEIHLGRSPGHHRNFLDSIKTRRQPVAHAEIGHRTATVCHLVNLAMITENEIVWDPQKEKIMNEPDFNRFLHPPMRSPWRL